jgi:ATP-dependent exoDNAse (exonuclease V) beta subunit
MTPHQLTISIIPAGAGSGKTHRIQELLVTKVRDEGLAPEQIVAVTFTEAAAAELRGRIRGALVNKGMLDEAFRLDQAYISTIHGFGLRLLTEFAFDGGYSPVPRMLNDDEQKLLVSRSLARSESAALMMQRLTKYGYTYDRNSDKSAEEVFRETVLKFIATLRTIGADADAGRFASGIEQQIRGLYGETRLAEQLKGRLLEAVKALLRQFSSGVAEISNVKPSISEGLRTEFISLKRAEKGEPLDSDWKLWKQLAELKTYKNPDKYFPAGYQDLAEEVIAAAQALPQHPGPLADSLEHASLLLGAAVDCLDDYSTDKHQRSLLDFTDMVALSRRLLCLDDSVIDCLRERVSYLVIDEFQDTNPLQFSLLWALTRRGIPTTVVGDLKQAIMGFQGADPRLLRTLCDQFPKNTDPLKENWRTDARLMAIINRFSSGLFGTEYLELEPKAEFTSLIQSPFEMVVAEKSMKNEVWASHLISRLHTLLNDPEVKVYDKYLKDYRRISGGDIAILCPTSRSRMNAYANALRAAGIPCRMPEDGWFQSRAVQLAFHALSYVADPGDPHAALYLAVTELGGLSLQDALKKLIAGEGIRQTELHGRLDHVAERCAELQADEVVAEVISVLDLYGRIALWDNAPQVRADLLRLQEEGCEFRNANREALAGSGYYGSGIKTFMAWLKDRIELDDRRPNPSALEGDAVQLVTWHSSKGREWPVVAVCGLDGNYAPRLPDTRVDYEDFADLDNILERVKVQVLPSFDSPETNNSFIGSLLKDADESAARLLYVALTRAREKLILEFPAYQASTDRKNKTYFDLFAERTGAQIAAGKLHCGVMGIDFYQVASDAETWDIASSGVPQSLTIGRRAIDPRPLPLELTAETLTPSSLHGISTDGVSPLEIQYASEQKWDFPEITDAAEKGKILHRAFEVLSGHPERKVLLSDAVGVALAEETADVVSDAVAKFDEWLARELKPKAILSEVPLLVTNEQGSVMHGFIDMVVEAADGLWVVDHKSDRVDDVEKRLERFRYYYPQLKCYAEALAKARPDKPVKGIMVNWISFGIVSVAGTIEG